MSDKESVTRRTLFALVMSKKAALYSVSFAGHDLVEGFMEGGAKWFRDAIGRALVEAHPEDLSIIDKRYDDGFKEVV